MSPNRDRLIFATRTTLAALLAAWIAFLVDLPQAATSMMTVLIVSQPLAGMVLSKSLYRVVGTCVGAVAAVALTAAFSGAPELFAVAISSWIGCCLAASIYLRDAPAAYGAMLSGYTAAMIAFPAVDAPDTVFQAALDRGSEIVVGIACAATLSQIFFPQRATNSLKAATEAAIAAASSWAAETLTGRTDPAKVLRDRRALVARVTTLDGLRIHATYDSAEARLANARIRLIHGRLMGFLALLVSIHDRLELIRASRPERLAALAPQLRVAADAMAQDASPEDRARARSVLLDALPDFAALRADRSKLLERTLLLRVADLVEFRGGLAAADEQAPAGGRSETIAHHRDHQLALASGLSAFAALLAVCAFWIASGWNAGAGAAIMVAVMASLFAQQDDPAAAAGKFFEMTAVGSALGAVYAFAVLPGLEGFEALAIALAPLLFAVAWGMAIPRLTLASLACGLGALNSIGLLNVMAPDFPNFANGALAQLFGIGVAAAMLRVLRPIGAAWPVARLTAGVRSGVADAVAGRGAGGRLAFESQMFDRIQGLMTRLDLSDPDQLALEQGALAALRVGLNAMALRRVVRDLPEEAGRPLADALAELARHFRALARGRRSTPPFARLEAALDAALKVELTDQELREVPVWISSVASSMAQHPRMFGGAPEAVAADQWSKAA